MNYMMLIHHDDAALAKANHKELWADPIHGGTSTRYAMFCEATSGSVTWDVAEGTTRKPKGVCYNQPAAFKEDGANAKSKD